MYPLNRRILILNLCFYLGQMNNKLKYQVIEMSHINDRDFCQDCFGHISKAQTLLRECNDSPCYADQYERIAFQFNALMSEAQASRFDVLAHYAQAMGSYARYLSDKDPVQISQLEHELLQDGIEAGLGCQQGTIDDKCIEQNYDRLWPCISKLRAQIESAETVHSH